MNFQWYGIFIEAFIFGDRRKNTMKDPLIDQEIELYPPFQDDDDKVLNFFGVNRASISRKSLIPNYPKWKIWSLECMRFCLIRGLPLAIGLLIIEILVVQFGIPDHFGENKVSTQIFFCFCGIFQLFVMVQAIRYFLKQALTNIIPLGFVMKTYISVIIGFTSFYLVCESFLPGQSFAISEKHFGNSFYKFFCAMFYFSAVTMSTIGFGDVYPTEWHSSTICMIEMFVGVCFHVFIFAISLIHLNMDQKYTQQASTGNENVRSRNKCYGMFFRYQFLINIFISIVNIIVLKFLELSIHVVTISIVLGIVNILFSITLIARMFKLYKKTKIAHDYHPSRLLVFFHDLFFDIFICRFCRKERILYSKQGRQVLFLGLVGDCIFQHNSPIYDGLWKYLSDYDLFKIARHSACVTNRYFHHRDLWGRNKQVFEENTIKLGKEI
jgi:hypothetical protein